MKYLNFALILFSLFFSFPKNESSSSMTIEDKAYEILSTKCNVCHASKNPKKVFTKANMSGFANKINRQVFVFKTMPKGNEIKLTSDETQILNNWINSLKS